VLDEHLRMSCFLWLEVLRARFGDDIPYKGGLDEGFPYAGRRVPFLSTQKGIFRAAAQTGPAALAIQTSAKSPCDDEETDLGFLYAYRSGSIDQPDEPEPAPIEDIVERRYAVREGLSLCTIHHRSFDQDLVGVSPDYTVHVARRLLDDEDGPMLDLLNRFHGSPLELPSRRAQQPNRDLLALRFERFAAA
jgi:hypothetical protein